MVIIRQIRLTDAEAFREALDKVCRERRYLAAFEAPALEDVQSFIASNVKLGHPQFVAEHTGRVVGWCDAIPGEIASGTAHVGRLGMGVVPDFRGKRIGLRLLEATIEMAKTSKLEKIELSVYASNIPAIRLYRKLGFEEEGLKKRGRLVDGVYDDVLLLALELNRIEGVPFNSP
jgi:ribosomal protein S18 acetylase RimI-like enzyme